MDLRHLVRDAGSVPPAVRRVVARLEDAGMLPLAEVRQDCHELAALATQDGLTELAVLARIMAADDDTRRVAARARLVQRTWDQDVPV